MNKINLFIISLLAAVSCSKLNTPEAIQIDLIGGYNTQNTKESEEYYKNLRDYKKQAENYGRPIAFGWFSNWAPAGLIRKGYLESMPDSMDVVSIWSGNWPLSEAKKKDMRLVQEKKGTKILACSLLSHLGKGCTPPEVFEKARQEGEAQGLTGSALNNFVDNARWKFWGFENGIIGSEEHLAAIGKFAKALADSMDKYNYDGFDIDWEPGIGFNDDDGTMSGSSNVGIKHFVKEMGKYIGPQCGQGSGHKLFVIDGLVTDLSAELGKYFDYFIMQSYGYGNPNMSHIPNHYGEEHGSFKKVIICENFESSSISGGVLLRQAEYLPNGKAKGGFGAYRFDNDYDNKPDYRWMRKGIQLNQESFKKAEQ